MNYSNFMPLKITLKTDPRWKQKFRKVTLSLQIHIIMLNLNLLPNIISDPSNQGKFVYSKTYYLDSFWLIQIHKHCTILSKKHKSKLQPTKKKKVPKRNTLYQAFDNIARVWLVILTSSTGSWQSFILILIIRNLPKIWTTFST